MRKLIPIFLLTLCTSYRTEAFTIGIQSNCIGSNVYSYHFSDTALPVDYTVRVSESELLPDITMQIVTDPVEADLILSDDLSQVDMAACISQVPHGTKAIKLSNLQFGTDINIKLTTYAYSPDYKIFVRSKMVTKEQAAALLAIILKSNRDQ